MKIELYEAKAAYLLSLAKSQEALARILNSIADVADHSSEAAIHLRDQAHKLTLLQETIAEAVMGLTRRSRIRKKGRPAEPWIQPGLRLKGTGRK